MGAPDPSKSYYVSGRLAYGCTDLSTAWPHGGTGLGLCGKVFYSPPSRYAVAEREEDGAAEKAVYLGGRATLGCELLQVDNDAYAAVFPSSSGGLTEVPGTGTLPGQEVPTLSNLVFTPTNQLEHPAVVLYKAIPTIEINHAMQLSSYRPFVLRLVFVGAPDSNDRISAMDLLANIPGVS